jgi:hypothetical protein
MKYKKFITTGCSFTAGVLESIDNQTAFAWPHFCVLDLGLATDDFLNFALPGGGNTAAISNLVYYLELNPDLDCALVGINLTALGRCDSMCNQAHLNANQDQSNKHIQQQLHIGWIHNSLDRHQVSRGSTALTIQSCLAIVQGITYLESKNIDYFFMLMTDSIYAYSPAWFQQFLDARQDHWVKFGEITGMLEFVEQLNLQTSSDDFHPSIQGHKHIADRVLAHLNAKKD